MKQNPALRNRLLIGSGLLIITTLILGWYFRLPRVHTARVVRGPLVVTFTAPGFLEGKRSRISSEVPGRIESLAVKEGDRVIKGQELAALDAREARSRLDAEAANLTAARAHLAEAETSYRLEERRIEELIRQAEAQVKSARAELDRVRKGPREEEIRQATLLTHQRKTMEEQTEKDLNRARELFRRGALPRQGLEQAEQAFSLARDQWRQAGEQERMLRKGSLPEEIQIARQNLYSTEAEYRLALDGRRRLSALKHQITGLEAREDQGGAFLTAGKVRLESHIIRAPFSGWVARVYGETGEMVAPGQPVFALLDDREIWVTGEVDHEDAGLLRPGQTMAFTSEALPGQEIEARILRISPEIEEKMEAAVKVKVRRIKLAPNTSKGLVPGMEVDIQGRVQVRDRALLVPSDACFRSGNRDVVLAVRSGKAYITEITPGRTNFLQTEVVRGLKEGEEVVVRNREGLKDGARVRK